MGSLSGGLRFCFKGPWVQGYVFRVVEGRLNGPHTLNSKPDVPPVATITKLLKLAMDLTNTRKSPDP